MIDKFYLLSGNQRKYRRLNCSYVTDRVKYSSPFPEATPVTFGVPRVHGHKKKPLTTTLRQTDFLGHTTLTKLQVKWFSDGMKSAVASVWE